jgi:hypothetical protein
MITIIGDQEGVFMVNSEQYYAQAAEYEKRGMQTDAPRRSRELRNLEQPFTELAENEDMDGAEFRKDFAQTGRGSSKPRSVPWPQTA